MRARDIRPATGGEGSSSGRFAARVLIALAIAAGFVLLWRITPVVMLLFGGVLLATLLSSGADAIAAHTRLPRQLALVLVAAAVLALFAGALALVGGRIAGQLGELYGQLPDALDQLRAWLVRSTGDVTAVREAMQFDMKETAARFASVAAGTANAVAHLVLVVFLGLYLAMDPGLYIRGTLALVPHAEREAAREALSAAGAALRRWLVGQLVAMCAVGAFTFAGLWALDIPYAMSLAFVAFVLEFVPFIGPILAAVPALLIAFTIGPSTALAVALLYLVIQQVEGNVVMPLVQRWAVSLPPALGVIAVVVFGLLFGIPGVLFATPLMVVAVVLVRKLYVERALGDPKVRVLPGAPE